MVASNQDKPLKRNPRFRGAFGTDISGGVYNEDYLGTLRGTNWAFEADKMRTQDGQVRMVLGSVLNPIRSANWEVIAADTTDPAKVAHRDFVEFILFCDMMRPWAVFLNEVLTFTAFGNSVFEILHKNVRNHPKFGNYTGIKLLGWRSPKTIEEWNVDLTTGELLSVTQRTTGDINVNVDIPAEFLLIFTMDLEGNDFSGTTRSLLRPIYGNYQLKQFYKKLAAIGHEKMTIGTPVGTIPNDASTEDEGTFESILELYTTHQQGYIKLPEGFTIDILRGEFDAEQLRGSIELENQEMVRSFLANFLNLGQGQQGGAYALGQDLSDFFLKGIQYIADTVCDTINGRLIPHIIDINFGEQDEYPELLCNGIQDVGEELSRTLSNYITVGAMKVDDTLRAHLRKLHKLPPEDEADTTAIIGVREEEVAIEPEEDAVVVAPDLGSDTNRPDTSTNPDPANEADVASDTQELSATDVDDLQTFATRPRTMITQGGQGIAEVMVLNLDFMANKLIADIINRFKNLPDGSKQKATQKVKVGGTSKYRKELRNSLGNLASLSINGAREEVGLEPIKFQDPLNINQPFTAEDFRKLPKQVRDKIIAILDTVVATQAADLEKAAVLQFGSSIDTTQDPNLLASDMKEKTDRVIDVAKVQGANNTSSEIVNFSRLDTFFDQESRSRIASFTFTNPDPQAQVCRELAGRTFSVDDAESLRNAPPLHHNCKSILVPNLVGDSNPEISRGGLRRISQAAEDSITFSDEQVIKILDELTTSGDIQTFMFKRIFFTRGEVVSWLANRAFRSDVIDETDEFLLARQRGAGEFAEGSLRTVLVTQGIKAVIGNLAVEMPGTNPPARIE